MAQERASCPPCQKAIALEDLREGVMPTAEHAADAAALAKEEAAVQNQAGPATRGNPQGCPSGYTEPRVLFESKLNALLEEVSPDTCLACLLLEAAA